MNTPFRTTTMDLAIWGPAGWTYLHACAMSFPDNATPTQEGQYDAFFRAVGPTLPCPTCATHYAAFLASHPPPVRDGRDALVDWTIDLHNDVRRRQGKRTFTRAQARRTLAHPGPPSAVLRSLCVAETVVLAVVVGIGLVTALVALLRRKCPPVS